MSNSFFLTVLISLILAGSITALDKEDDCQCRILPQSRIIGGKLAHHTAYPWQVIVAIKDTVPVPDFLRKRVPDFIKVSFCI